ncbi:FHA domain-containing protein [Geodermatophilus sp. SYSU D00779]
MTPPGVQEFRSGFPGSPVLVDVSNICWDAAIPPVGRMSPIAARLRDVVAVLRRSGVLEMRCVADTSLRHVVQDVRGTRAWQQFADEFALEEAQVADELLLTAAQEDRRAQIISRDNFIDHRRSHRWIDAEAGRFWKPRRRRGELGFVLSGVRPVPGHAVSRSIEVKELKSLGIDPRDHREILATRWRCTNPHCLQARLWQDVLHVWPRVDRAGLVVCPACRQPAAAVGARGRSRQLIAKDPTQDGECFRFVVEEGAPVVLGRGQLRSGISVDAFAPALERLGRISRQHVLIEVTEAGSVRITDLGSTNGTSVRRTGSMEWRRLPAHDATGFNVGDALDVAQGLRLQLSGRVFVLDQPQAGEAGGPGEATEIDSEG